MDLDPPTTSAIVESLASGCLTTTFVWLQHRNPVRAIAASDTPGLRDRWLGPLCRGERRAGIALAGSRPGPPILRATSTRSGDVLLNGEAPWVSGWERVDVALVTARIDDTVVSTLVDTRGSVASGRAPASGRRERERHRHATLPRSPGPVRTDRGCRAARRRARARCGRPAPERVPRSGRGRSLLPPDGADLVRRAAHHGPTHAG